MHRWSQFRGPHLSPDWFCWDGERFYVSTRRGRAKYAILRRDPRAQLLIDDPAGFGAVLVPATVQIREDIAAELPVSAPSGTSTGWRSQMMRSICGP